MTTSQKPFGVSEIEFITSNLTDYLYKVSKLIYVHNSSQVCDETLRASLVTSVELCEASAMRILEDTILTLRDRIPVLMESLHTGKREDLQQMSKLKNLRKSKSITTDVDYAAKWKIEDEEQEKHLKDRPRADSKKIAESLRLKRMME